MIEIKAFEEGREVPVPCYTARVLAEVLSERSYQNKTWGTAFDDKNTLNDWVAYAVIYLGQAARMKAPPDEQRKGILKAATLLVGGIEAFDRNNNSFAPRQRNSESHTVKRGLVKHPGDWPWSRRGREVLFLERRFDLGHGQNAVMASTNRGWRIHPDKNRRDVCATRGS